MRGGTVIPDDIVFPQYLFRYRSLESSYAWAEMDRALRAGEVYLSAASYVNDPFDFSPKYTASPLKEVLTDLKLSHGHKRMFSRDDLSRISGRRPSRYEYRRISKKPSFESSINEILAAERLIGSLKRRTNLACFSELGLSIPMWAHYASAHRGVCYRYKVEIAKAKAEREEIPMQVKYVSDRPSISTMDLRAFTERSKAQGDDAQQRLDVHDALFLSKANDWSYEREWRIFQTDDAGPRYKHLSSLTVDAMYFGLRSLPEGNARAKQEYGSRVRLYELQQSRNEFTFELSEF